MAASNFSSLRSSRKDLLAKLAAQAKKENAKGGQDDRFWKLTVDAKTKIGSALIRFLPPPQNEELSYVRKFAHQFKGPHGQWLFENCPTTLGGKCPICAENNKLWNSGVDADKNIARDRKRKQRFITNILVLEDNAHPENNGKVFLYECGPKVYDKLKEKFEPEFPEQEPMDPFDMWDGANFRLRSRDDKGYQSYDKSTFEAASELYPGDDAKKEEVWLKQYSLSAFVDAKEFKSYEDLEKSLARVLSGDSGRPKTAEDAIKQVKESAAGADEAKDVAERVEKEEKKATRIPRTPKRKDPEPEPEPVEEPGDDDVAEFFKNLED